MAGAFSRSIPTIDPQGGEPSLCDRPPPPQGGNRPDKRGEISWGGYTRCELHAQSRLVQCVPSPTWQTLVLYVKQLFAFLFQAVFCPPPPPPRGIFAARVVTNTNHTSPMKSTRAPSSSRGVQRGLSEMPDVATQAHPGPRSQGSDHGSKSQRAGTEKRAGVSHLPSRSDSTRKGTHHVVKSPDQAGMRGPARGPTHLHPTRDNTVNPATTRSYVEVVRGVALRSGWPTTASGPPHVTRYILLPRAPTHTPQHPDEGRGFVLRGNLEAKGCYVPPLGK